jgi:hypothetical protein
LAAGLKPKILCVGRDPSLNRTRQLVLERQFEVRVAQSVTEAFALLSGQRFDLVLLCYSLSDEECRSAADFVHGLPSPIRILALAEGRERLALAKQDEEFVSSGPAELLKKAAAMVEFPAEDTKRRKAC